MAHFPLFVIGASKYIFKAIMFTNAAFIHKIDAFLSKFLSEKLATYRWFCIIKLYRGRYFEKNKCIHLLGGPILEYDNDVHK